MSAQTKLKFRITYSSSEEKEYPVTELLKHGPHSKGWHSARFDEYPQVIIFQFICPVRIQQLQFLSHQFKISSKIELYINMPEDPDNLPPMEYFKWKRLGYLSLDSNEESNFQARELKSVYIDAQALFLKIVLNNCHSNAHNIYNQVGLIAINALGTELGNLKPPTVKGLPARLENEMEFDAATSEQLKQLLYAKDKAVEHENFEEAKRLKEAVDRLRSAGYQLVHLEERKRQAIAAEDYDAAKSIKTEIERLRGAVAPANNAGRPRSGLQTPASRGPQQPPEEPEYQARKEKLWGEPSPRAKDYDEQVIPALKADRKPQFAEEFPEDENVAESLDPSQRQRAEFLLPLIGEELCQQLFSRTWGLREQALSTLVGALGDPKSALLRMGPEELYAAVLGAVRCTVGDKVAQVALRAMNLLGTLLSSGAPQENLVRGDIAESTQSILGTLLDRAGDSNQRVKDSAEASFIALASHELADVTSAVQLILKSTKEKPGSHKHIQGRLSLLNSLVGEFKIGNSAVPFRPVLDYALKGFTHSNGDIRNSAYFLIISIYSTVGRNLMKHLSELRPAQLDILEKGFAQVDAGAHSQPLKEALATPMCSYCGKKDSLFMNQDNLDIHYWKDCPMLTSCPNCRQVTEVAHLNLHLKSECQMKGVMQQCARCKEPVHIDEFEQHSEEQACIPAKASNVANRCPLCHDDVGPGLAGWKEHILTEGCPNNDRSNF